MEGLPFQPIIQNQDTRAESCAPKNPRILPLRILLLLWTMLPVCASLATRRSHVYKHGLLELAGTLDCVGPRSPMAYVNYGCYCGLGGHGECCHHHDCCYSQAQDAGCSPKLDCYPWKYMDHVSFHPTWGSIQFLDSDA
uniref:Phospholipase A2-like central domain-containing protein n=1 Tax=Mus spicilegus TaxID=10103 RepID=A0A8C6H8Y4_MUSSI